MKDRIIVAFSFDHNYYRQCGVSIASLLYCANNKVDYDIYCLCAKDVTNADKNNLSKIVKNKSKRSNLFFIQIREGFELSYEIREITRAAYFRLCLHNHLPDIDKIIYSDVDILFKDDLMEVWNTKLGDNFVGAVMDPLVNLSKNFKEFTKKYNYFREELSGSEGQYFNSGFLLMNLKKIRESTVSAEWIEMSRREFYFVDQDILNITCKNHVLFLPSKFNILVNLLNSNTYDGLILEDKITAEEYDMILSNQSVLHFAGSKPWHNKNVYLSDEWWKFMQQHTNFNKYFCQNYHAYLKNNSTIKDETANLSINRNTVVSKSNRIFVLLHGLIKVMKLSVLKLKLFTNRYVSGKKHKLIMTLLVRDEVDIIEENINFHIAHGVDFIIATDNGSIDGTRDILMKYQDQGVLYLIDEPSQGYSQADWVNRMGRIARQRYGAKYVFHCDADEFWYAKSGNIMQEIFLRKEKMLKVRLFNVLPCDMGNREKFPDDVRYVVVKPFITSNLAKDSKKNSLYLYAYPPKVIFKSHFDVIQGNHDVVGLDNYDKKFSEDIVIYHYPIRGRDHFYRKIINGGKSYENNKRLGKDVGFHWRRWYESYKDGKLDIEYKKLILTECDVARFKKSGVIKIFDFKNIK